MAELVETPQAHDQGRKGRGRCGRHRPGPGRGRPYAKIILQAFLLEFPTAGGTHRLHYPKSAKGRELAQGAVVTLYYNPDDPAEMYVEGDKSVLGAEVLYVVLGIVLLVLMAGIVR